MSDGIDLTRMECKFNRHTAKRKRFRSIDLTRMKCKLWTGAEWEEIPLGYRFNQNGM